MSAVKNAARSGSVPANMKKKLDRISINPILMTFSLHRALPVASDIILTTLYVSSFLLSGAPQSAVAAVKATGAKNSSTPNLPRLNQIAYSHLPMRLPLTTVVTVMLPAAGPMFVSVVPSKESPL